MRNYLREVEDAIKIRKTQKQKTYHLCLDGEKVVCLPRVEATILDDNGNRKYEFLRNLSGSEIDNGLTSKEWNKLEGKLRGRLDEEWR